MKGHVCSSILGFIVIEYKQVREVSLSAYGYQHVFISVLL